MTASTTSPNKEFHRLCNVDVITVMSDSLEASLTPAAAHIQPFTLVQSSLQVTMCRYHGGQLERVTRKVIETQYIAISHVWEEAEWQPVLGIDGEILVSKEKAKFMAKRLSAVVGNNYFWMDILCVEQRDKAARIAVTQHMPTIFRHAQRTIVLRDGSGFQNCCVAAMDILRTGSISEKWYAGTCEGRKRLIEHYEAIHKGEDFMDGIISRLWPFQEIMLSDVVQFVRCDNTPTEPRRNQASIVSHGIEFSNVLTSLDVMSSDWASHGDGPSPATNIRLGSDRKFLYAYFTCSTAIRTRTAEYLPVFPTDNDFWTHLTSTRRTGKSRDFILAVMPQYRFYNVPSNARTMSFGQLFVDCLRQLQLGRITRLSPLIREGLDDSFTEDIPEPLFLGDFVKLCYGPKLYRGSVIPVQVEEADHRNAFGYIKQVIRESKIVWGSGSWGELMILSKLRQDLEAKGERDAREAFLGFEGVAEAIETLLNISLSRVFSQQECQALNSAVFLRAAALISCGVGLSALEWSRQNWTPVFVNYKAKIFLALAPHSVLHHNSDCKFYLVDAERYWITDGARFALVASTPDAGSFTMCLFPPDVSLNYLEEPQKGNP